MKIINSHITIILIAVISIICSPLIDIAFSSIFYDSINESFYLKNFTIFKFIRKGFPEIMGVFAAILAIIGAINHFFHKYFLKLTIKETYFLLLSAAIGPGLIVNSFLKTFSGRARPSQISFFGGDKIFSPAYQFVNECENNCSFASGHAAFAFWLTSLAMIAPEKYQKKLMVVCLLIGLLVSFTRIVQGGHFLSDVITGGVIALLTNIWTYKLIYKKSYRF